MSNKDSKKVAIFLAPGFEETEATTPYDLLFRAGIPVDLISILSSKEVTSSHELTIRAKYILDEVDLEQYDMLVLPGGIPGMPNLKANQTLSKALTSFAEQGKQLAAICASPSILAELGLLKGKTATANPGFQSILVANGAKLTQTTVAVDGNIITSKGAGTSLDFGLALVRHYGGEKAVAEVKKGLAITD